MKKRRAISPLFHNILLPVVRFSCLGRTRFSLRDKRLFEISEVEIKRVNCTVYSIHHKYWNRQIRARSVDPDQIKIYTFFTLIQQLHFVYSTDKYGKELSYIVQIYVDKRQKDCLWKRKIKHTTD